jgi:hypothetical protein
MSTTTPILIQLHWPTYLKLSKSIFQQHDCDNLKPCNVIFFCKIFGSYSSIDEDSHLKCYTMLVIKKPPKHWWLIKQFISQNIPQDLNLTSCSLGPNVIFSISDFNFIILTKIISLSNFWSRAYSSLNVRMTPCLLSTSLMKLLNLWLQSFISCTHNSVMLCLKMPKHIYYNLFSYFTVQNWVKQFPQHAMSHHISINKTSFCRLDTCG